MLHNTWNIAKKELSVFFTSPMAFLFIGGFLAAILFIFFWVETFFARNIADVQPLFEWMPILLAPLCGALTMKQWSEEKRSGTLEFLLSKPISPLQLVLGKFLGCFAMVSLSVALTCFIPFTVAKLGNLDLGPVLGAYLATLCLAATYLSIGLTVSATTDNPIVSLILATGLCGIFYALGSDLLTAFFPGPARDLLKALGTGSRFSSITRGVIDLRDIYYYVSLIATFTTLNIYALLRHQWLDHDNRQASRPWQLWSGLLIINLLTCNLWLSQLGSARLDLTQGAIYSISPATTKTLQQLKEPLRIRAFISDKLHPLLAPLAPQLKHLVEEFKIAAPDKLSVEIVDPLTDNGLEQEVHEKYGIETVPFQIADKYQASLVNAYFHIVVEYGDKHEVLGFRDLIEIQSGKETQIDVKLKNPEYEITRSIKKVTKNFQNEMALFQTIAEPIQFTAYLSEADKLPAPLKTLREALEAYLQSLEADAQGKLIAKFVAPEANAGEVAQQISEQYGFKPMRASILDPNTFYFYLLMQQGKQRVQIALPESLSIADLKRNFEAGLKRFSPGFMKTIALATPPAPNPMQHTGGPSFKHLRQRLNNNYRVVDADLNSGQVAEESDLLLVAAPTELSEQAVYAIDQFLMRGGSVILATSPYSIVHSHSSFVASQHQSGLQDWLSKHGISLQQTLILDPQNSRLPIPVQRQIRGITLQDLRLINYPYFSDIRSTGLNTQHLISSGLPQVTFNWASPIQYQTPETGTLQATTLAQTSAGSWLSESTQVMPNLQLPDGFIKEESAGPQTVALMLEGEFHSFFEAQPTAPKPASEPNGPQALPEENAQPSLVVNLTKSPESARLVVLASNELLSDNSIQLASALSNDDYLNSIQMVENCIDWSLEDRQLLSIRSRGHFNRTLFPITTELRMFWEYLNYAVVVMALFGLWLVRKLITRQTQARYKLIITEGV